MARSWDVYTVAKRSQPLTPPPALLGHGCGSTIRRWTLYSELSCHAADKIFVGAVSEHWCKKRLTVSSESYVDTGPESRR